MKTLLIMRHGSAESTGSDGSDYSRTLTGLGESEAAIQGRFLFQAGIVPQVASTSSALRAQTTAEQVLSSILNPPELSVEEDLYNAPGFALLDYVKTLPEPAQTALIVAHMPGVAELLAMLTSDFAEVTVAYAPATLSCVTFPMLTKWKQINQGLGQLEWLLPPLMLER